MQKRVLHVHTKSRTKSQWTLKNDLHTQSSKIITKDTILLLNQVILDFSLSNIFIVIVVLLLNFQMSYFW